MLIGIIKKLLMTMIPIKFNDVYFHIEEEDEHNIHFSIRISSDAFSEELWECRLKGLWRDDLERETPDLLVIWGMHQIGDFFQETLIRHNKKMHPGVSYTAWFHDMYLANRHLFDFINNIYSTSKNTALSMGFDISPNATNFWNKQVEKNIALYIENESRFRLLI